MTAVATGTAGNTPFANRQITITAQSDTSTVLEIFPGQYYLARFTTAAVDIAGIGSGTFNGTGAFLNDRLASRAGFSIDSVADLLYTTHPAFGPYDLKSPIGPVLGTESLAGNWFTNVPTSLGALTISSVQPAGAFTAVAVPEPATVWLLIATLLLVTVVRRLRHMH
jgi:hypothetical protein